MIDSLYPHRQGIGNIKYGNERVNMHEFMNSPKLQIYMDHIKIYQCQYDIQSNKY